MAYQIKWSEKSKKDFIEIIEYLILSWGNNSAKKFKNTVFNTLDIISKFPKIYPKTEYRENIRRCVVVKQVSLYFQVNEYDKEIYIVRFIDNRRDPKKQKELLIEKDS